MIHKFIAGWKGCPESSVSHGAPHSGGVRGKPKHQALATPWVGARCVTNSATISAVDELIRQDRRITTSEIAVELSISKGTVHHRIHKKLGYGKICAQWVPKHMSENQKTAGMGVCLTQQFLLFGEIWILSDSRGVIQYLVNWRDVSDRRGLDIFNKTQNPVQYLCSSSTMDTIT
ncbi:hypothetical protein AVEN_133573-1 [Araneus ventricosus]|uniref:Mos1 transposase HTH domain-containing protein n=1 Tax=Araneus ventricosus TaxID=182803 RepID=A0A4Y2R0C8_ARAVE|nr:hypothetical protein AVEN_133573-1 [Araneus ventricosus]